MPGPVPNPTPVGSNPQRYASGQPHYLTPSQPRDYRQPANVHQVPPWPSSGAAAATTARNPGMSQGELPPPDPNNEAYWQNGYFDYTTYEQDYLDWLKAKDQAAKGGAGGTDAARAAQEMALAQAAEHRQAVAAYIGALGDSLSADIANKRLRADEAVQEFNRHLQALTEGRAGFLGAQDYTIPQGAKYIPGFEPGGVATQVGMAPVEASPLQYNPFQMAQDIVNQTPNITDIGGGNQALIDQMLEAAKQFGVG